jgi:hypothetical protein
MKPTLSRRKLGIALAGGTFALITDKAGAQTPAATPGTVVTTRYTRELMSPFPPRAIFAAEAVAESERDAELVWGSADNYLETFEEDLGTVLRTGRELDVEERENYKLDRGVIFTFDGVDDGDPFEGLILIGIRGQSVFWFAFLSTPRDDDGMPTIFHWFVRESVEFGLSTADVPAGMQEYGPTGGTFETATYDVTSDTEFRLPGFGTPVATPGGN